METILFVIVCCHLPAIKEQPKSIAIGGYAKKDLLIKGSQITAYALDSMLVATDEFLNTQSICYGSADIDIDNLSSVNVINKKASLI